MADPASVRRGHGSRRAGRQQPAVAHASFVEHGNVDVSTEPVVLQAIVGHDQIDLRVGLNQGPGRLYPVIVHEHRDARALFDKKGFVTTLLGRQMRLHLQAGARAPAVTARDDPRVPALLLQLAHQRHHQRCFASAAGREVAHDDHRHRQAMHRQAMHRQPGGSIQPQPHRAQGPIDQGQGPEQARCDPAALPNSGQP